MSAPELRPGVRPRAPHGASTRAAHSSGLSLFVVAAALAGALATAVWIFGKLETIAALTAETAELRGRVDQLESELSVARAEAIRSARLAQAAAAARTTAAPLLRPPPASTPRPTAPVPRFAPSPARPAPQRRSSVNAAIRAAEARCDAVGYGTVDERHCRRAEWQKMRDRCHKLRREEAFVTVRNRDAHAEELRTWCDAERSFQIIH